MSDKQDQVARLEKAISQKYGQEAVDNPRRFWDDDKEKEYLQQSQQEQKKFAKLAATQDKVEEDGFLINKKLLTKIITGLVLCAKNILLNFATICI